MSKFDDIANLIREYEKIIRTIIILLSKFVNISTKSFNQQIISQKFFVKQNFVIIISKQIFFINSSFVDISLFVIVINVITSTTLISWKLNTFANRFFVIISIFVTFINIIIIKIFWQIFLSYENSYRRSTIYQFLLLEILSQSMSRNLSWFLSHVDLFDFFFVLIILFLLI